MDARAQGSWQIDLFIARCGGKIGDGERAGSMAALMTERQQARLLKAYVALALLMAGVLLHNFLSHTLVNATAESRVSAIQSLSAPASFANPEGRRLHPALRLARVAGGGGDQVADGGCCQRRLPHIASAAGPLDDGRRDTRSGVRAAHRPRGPPHSLTI